MKKLRNLSSLSAFIPKKKNKSHFYDNSSNRDSKIVSQIQPAPGNSLIGPLVEALPQIFPGYQLSFDYPEISSYSFVPSNNISAYNVSDKSTCTEELNDLFQIDEESTEIFNISVLNDSEHDSSSSTSSFNGLNRKQLIKILIEIRNRGYNMLIPDEGINNFSKSNFENSFIQYLIHIFTPKHQFLLNELFLNS
jgi:hypothetical protein